MVNFSSFDSFGKLDSNIAYEAMNNADRRWIDLRTKLNGYRLKSNDERRALAQMEVDASQYADTWIQWRHEERLAKLRSEIDEMNKHLDRIHALGDEAELLLSSKKPAEPEVERQCAYCGSTKGFDGWNCIDCGAC